MPLLFYNKRLLKAISILFFLSLASNSYARIGLGDWACRTPNGSKINNYTGAGLSLRLKNGQQIQELSSWYFYRDNIIGKLDNKTYFIANETTGKIYNFQTNAEFNYFIQTHKYKPILWTRWYNARWSFLDDILFISFLFFPITILATILFCTICYKSILSERLNYRKPFTIALFIILAIVLTSTVSQQFPQSI